MLPKLFVLPAISAFATLAHATSAPAPIGVLINAEGGQFAEFDSVEYDYEVRGPLVFGEKPTGEIMLKKADGSTVWQQMPPKTRIRTVEQLFSQDRLTFLTQHWDAKLFYEPSTTSDFSQRQAFRLPDRKLPKADARYPFREARDVQVLEQRTDAGVVWLKVKLVAETACIAKDGKVVYAKHPVTGKEVEGWVPLKDAKGNLNFWYYSRGC